MVGGGLSKVIMPLGFFLASFALWHYVQILREVSNW